MSSSVVSSPNEKRTLELAASASPIASRTADGSAVPALHALPAETDTPSRSRAATSSGPFQPGKATFVTWGIRGGAAAVDAGARRPSRRRPSSRRSRKGPTACHRDGADRACRAAAASPAAATGSVVPGRTPRSWLPPRSTAAMATPGFAIRAPIDFRSADLRACPRGSACRRRTPPSPVRPNAWTASTCTQRPVRRARRRDRLADRKLDDARLGVHRLHRDEPHAPLAERPCEVLEIEHAVGAHADPPHAGAPFPLEALRDPRHGRVLEPARDQEPRRGRERGAQRHVVRLGPSGREDDVPRIAPGQARDRLARASLDLGARRASGGVHARRIAPRAPGGTRHRLDDLRKRRRRGVPVEIDATHARGPRGGAAGSSVRGVEDDRGRAHRDGHRERGGQVKCPRRSRLRRP